ncbi:MAG: hypothetical protein ACJAUW_001976, partial [Yoonia sp.]
RFKSFSAQFFAKRRRAGVLPHDGIVERFAGFFVPYQGRFTLVCNANRHHILRSDSRLIDCPSAA